MILIDISFAKSGPVATVALGNQCTVRRFASETNKILLWNNKICFTAQIFGATCELGCFHLLSKLSFLTFVLKVKKKNERKMSL